MEDHLVSEETQAKLQAMKMMVRWLLGMRNNENNVAVSTLRLLSTMLTHDGDLMEKGQIWWVIFCRYDVFRVPTRTGKPGKMGRHFPVREKSGNFEQTGKFRENHTKYWKTEIN